MEHQTLRNPMRREQMNSELPSYGSMGGGYAAKRPAVPAMRPNASVDEFGDLELEKSNVNKIMRTGRQRKKIASRSKGGEFQQRRKKRRVYFCCVSNEIDIEHLHDNFDKLDDRKWNSRMYEGVLHLYFASPQSHDASYRENNFDKSAGIDPNIESEYYFQGSPDLDEHSSLGNYKNSLGNYNNSLAFTDYLPIITEEDNHDKIDRNIELSRNGSIDRLLNSRNNITNESDRKDIRTDRDKDPGHSLPLSLLSRQLSDQPEENENQTASMLVLTGGKEVFVFDFGAVVFWGFKHGEKKKD